MLTVRLRHPLEGRNDQKVMLRGLGHTVHGLYSHNGFSA